MRCRVELQCYGPHDGPTRLIEADEIIEYIGDPENMPRYIVPLEDDYVAPVVETRPEPTALSQAVSRDSEILRALYALDPDDDESWTAQGLPSMDAINDILGGDPVTRDMVKNVAPDFARPA